MMLGEYLQGAMRETWGWGGRPGIDCCKLGARWVVACGHPDPMAFLHPLYDSERSALLTIRRGGGLVPLWTHGMADAGVPEVDDPSAGVVGVLEVPTEDQIDQAVGIFTGERWAVRQQAGMHFGPAEPLRMWRP
jgi:hypothetical protein